MGSRKKIKAMQKILLIAGFSGNDADTFPNACRVKGTNTVVFINGTSRKEDLRNLMGVTDDMDIEEMKEEGKDFELYVLAEESIQTLTRNIDLAKNDIVMGESKDGEPLYELTVPRSSLTLVDVSADIREILENCQDSEALKEFTERDILRRKAVAQAASTDREALKAQGKAAMDKILAARAARRAGTNPTPVATPVGATPTEEPTTADNSLAE